MRTRSTLATLVALVSLLGLVLVNVGGASGLHDTADNVLRLHLDTDGDYFAHDGLQQDLEASQCRVTTASQDGLLVDISDTSNPGISFDSLGVRSGGPGRSCGRVSGSEALTLSLNNDAADALEGLNFESMELDVEAKQDAWVLATATLGDDPVGTFELRTGGSVVAFEGTDPAEATPWLATSTSADPIANCLGRSDSGSDNGANDNCRWVVAPDVPFDTVTFTALSGEFGLEGGEDGTPAATEGENSDSLFYLTDVGVLNCLDEVETGDGLGDPRVEVTRRFQADCQLKEFFLESSASLPVGGSQSFTFDPSGGGTGQEDATFDLTITWVAEAAQNPVPPTQMDFNGDGDLDEPLEGDLVWCDGTAANPVLPSTGEPWCLVEQHTTLVGTGMMQVVERLYGTEDPNGWR